MYCGRCGKPNDDGARFCLYCGQPLRAADGQGAAGSGKIDAIGGPAGAGGSPHAEPAGGAGAKRALSVEVEEPEPAPEPRPSRRRLPRMRRRTLALLAMGGALLLAAAILGGTAWRSSERFRRAEAALDEAAAGQDTLPREELLERYRQAWQEPELRARALKHLAAGVGDKLAARRKLSLEILLSLCPDWAANQCAVDAAAALDRLRREGNLADKSDAVNLLRAIARCGAAGPTPGSDAAVGSLIEATTDEQVETSQQAMAALDEVSPRWPDDERTARLVPRLVKAVGDAGAGGRSSATLVLRRAGGRQAVTLLIPLLADADADVRRRARDVLGEIDSRWPEGPEAKAAVPKLCDALQAAGEACRDDVAGALGRIGDARAAGPLLRTFLQSIERQGSGAPLLAALEQLEPSWRSGPEAQAAADRCIELLTGPVPIRRRDAAAGLGAIGDGRAVEPLLAAYVFNGDWPNDGDTFTALDRIARRLSTRKQLDAAVPRISPAARSSDDAQRRRAVTALRWTDSTAAIPALVGAAVDRVQDIREIARTALDHIDRDWPRTEAAKTIVDALVEELRTGPPIGREETARLLGRLGDPRGTAALLELYGKPLDGSERSTVEAALTELTKDDQAPLLEALTSQNDLLRTGAQRATADIYRKGGLFDEDIRREEAEKAAPRMIAALKSAHAAVRLSAATWLGKLDLRKARDPLIAAMDDQDADVRLAAVGSLAGMGDAKVLDAMMNHLAEPDTNVGAAIEKAIRDLGTAALADRLRPLAEGPAGIARDRARRLLERFQN